MKFDLVTRFRETISTVKSVSSTELSKIFKFPTEITFLPFFRKIEFFPGFTNISVMSNLNKQTLYIVLDNIYLYK